MKSPTSSPYEGLSELTGPLTDGKVVKYTKTLTARDQVTLWIHLLVNFAIGLGFLAFLGFVTWMGVNKFGHHSRYTETIQISLASLMGLIEGLRMLQSFTLGFFTVMARDPIPMQPLKGKKLGMETTWVPGKEPWPMILEALLAAKEVIVPPGCSLDVWVLAEGFDAQAVADCERFGIKYFNRHDPRYMGRYTTKRGRYMMKTKFGNQNAFLSEHGASYDFFFQADPDHLPTTDALMRNLGYFVDPDVGFVVLPQVYGRNMTENWMAHASGVLAYIFHGVIQRGLNGLGAPLMIGTNHMIRIEAWRQIGGYAAYLVEDHASCIKLYQKRNPETGNRWKGVYSPDICADGAGPATFTDFYNQQMRWAYGIWQIIFRLSPRDLWKLTPRQALAFAMLQQFYPSVAISYLASFALTGLYVFSGVGLHMPMVPWAVLWASSVGSSLYFFIWLRRFNLAPHERKDLGFDGMCLMLMTTTIFVKAAITACLGRKLTYVVTAKGDLAAKDRMSAFNTHAFWFAVAAALFTLPFFGIGSNYWAMHMWMAIAIVFCAFPVGAHLHFRNQARKEAGLSVVGSLLALAAEHRALRAARLGKGSEAVMPAAAPQKRGSDVVRELVSAGRMRDWFEPPETALPDGDSLEPPGEESERFWPFWEEEERPLQPANR
jgi:cellulose synthase (UDP-forming)